MINNSAKVMRHLPLIEYPWSAEIDRLLVSIKRDDISFLQPEIVIMENVYGLAQVKTADMLKEIYKSFESIGYAVKHRELMAADYGTPQRRRRLFFIAAKNLSYFQFPQPTHSEETSIFGLLPYVGAGNTLMKLPPALIK